MQHPAATLETSQMVHACQYTQVVFSMLLVVCIVSLWGHSGNQQRLILVITFAVACFFTNCLPAFALYHVKGSITPNLIQAIFDSPNTVVIAVLGVDFAVIAFAVWYTGGSAQSGIAPLYFYLPTMVALLLPGDSHTFRVYSFLVSVAYCLTLRYYNDYISPTRQFEYHQQALAGANLVLLALMTVGCFVLSLFLTQETEHKAVEAPKYWDLLVPESIDKKADTYTLLHSLYDFKASKKKNKCFLYGKFRVLQVDSDYTLLEAVEPKANKITIRVEFPFLLKSPATGELIDRDKNHPFEVTCCDIPRHTLYAREFVLPVTQASAAAVPDGCRP